MFVAEAIHRQRAAVAAHLEAKVTIAAAHLEAGAQVHSRAAALLQVQAAVAHQAVVRAAAVLYEVADDKPDGFLQIIKYPFPATSHTRSAGIYQQTLSI